MTNEEWEELGRRAVACKHWRWMRGMTALAYHRTPKTQSALVVSAVHGDGIVLDGYVEAASAYYPDLSDPATLGCLLHLVREAWTQDGAQYRTCVDMEEDLYFGEVTIWPAGPKLAEMQQFRSVIIQAALVAALEAAP